MEELELSSDFSKSIHVTTTITNTQSTRDDRNIEVSTNSGLQRGETVRELKEGSVRGVKSADSIEDIGHNAMVEAGRVVTCTSGRVYEW